MRTIKFRAWYKEKMYNYVEHTTYHDGSSACTMLHKDPDRAFGPESDHCILMQFTGLYDKNGKEIYEGDIVTYPNPECFGVVKFGYYEFGEYDTYQRGVGFYIEPKDTQNAARGYFNPNEVWVIGNLHENPELL